jgi:hypothetical protein
MAPPVDIIEDFVWQPLAELQGVDFVFAFGKAWLGVCEALRLKEVGHWGRGRLRHTTETVRWFVVLSHGLSTFTTREAQQLLEGASPDAVRRALSRLQESGQLFSPAKVLHLLLTCRSGGALERSERLQVRDLRRADGQELRVPGGHPPMVTLMRGWRMVR